MLNDLDKRFALIGLIIIKSNRWRHSIKTTFWFCLRSVRVKDIGDNMKKKVLKIGIIPREDYKKRTIAIARGEYKPKKGEPKVWFDSINSMAQVLSSENQKLLKLSTKRNRHL